MCGLREGVGTERVAQLVQELVRTQGRSMHGGSSTMGAVGKSWRVSH